MAVPTPYSATGYQVGTIHIAAVPEPAVLAIIGLVPLLGMRRRRPALVG